MPPLGQSRNGEAGGNTASVWLDSAVPLAGCPRTQQAVHLPHGCLYQAMRTWQGLVPSLPEPPQQAGPASQSSQDKAKRPLSGFNSELGPPGPGTTTQEAKVSTSWGLGLTWLVLWASLLSRNIFSNARKVRKPAMTHSPSCCCCCRLCPSPPAGGGADRPGQARAIARRPFGMGPSPGQSRGRSRGAGPQGFSLRPGQLPARCSERLSQSSWWSRQGLGHHWAWVLAPPYTPPCGLTYQGWCCMCRPRPQAAGGETHCPRGPPGQS